MRPLFRLIAAPRARQAACWGLLGLALTGCAEESGDYLLELVPRILDGQAPFDEAPEIRLYIDNPEHVPAIHDLGQAHGPTLQQPELPPLPAGTLLGVLAERPGGQAGKYNPSRLVAYGEHLLDHAIDYDEEPYSLPILVAERGHVGGLGFLPEAALLSALALLPNGDAFLFGGAPGLQEPARDRILVLRDLNGGDWSFTPSVHTLPQPRVGLTATPIEPDGEPQILLTGGRPDAALTTESQADILIFDPVTEQIVWGLEAAHPAMSVRRSEHQALPIPGGVLLFGGYAGPSGTEPASFDLFDPVSRSILASGPLPIGAHGAAGAWLDDRAVLCGGVDPSDDPETPPVVTSTCVSVDPEGVVRSFPALPIAVAHHAMIALPDGQLLLTGGLIDADDPSPAASARAFLFDGLSWEEVEPMRYPRARHALIPVPRHDVLVVGGVVQSEWIATVGSGNQPCPEGFHLQSMSFRAQTDRCSLSGTGAGAPWSWQPGIGAMGLEGWIGDGGGFRYGLTAFGPDL